MKPALPPRQELMRLMRQASYKHAIYDVFRDFCEMSAIAMSNAVDLAHREEREARYLETVKKYDEEHRTLFPKMFACLVEALEAGYDDVLGPTFMELEIGNKSAGQFFTPYSLCKMTAQMQIDDALKEKVAERGYVTVGEPACGGGAMLIAFAEAMREAGLNPQTQMHFTAQDVDPRSAHMTYVQLSLLNMPGIVRIGNTLTMEITSEWFTPAHILGGWSRKLMVRPQVVEKPAAVVPVEVPPVPSLPDVRLSGEQIAMFSD